MAESALISWIVELIVLALGSIVGTFMAGMFYGWWAYSRLETRIVSLENGIKGTVGNAARKEKSERMQAAMTEAMLALKEGKQPMDVLKEVGSRYPDVAMELMKKGGI